MTVLRSLLHLLLAIAVLAQPALAERVGCCCAANRMDELNQQVTKSSPKEAKVAAGCPRCRAKSLLATERNAPSQSRIQKNCRCISVAAPAVTQDRKSAAVELPAKTRAEHFSVRLLSVSRPEVVRAKCSGVKLTGRELRVWHCSWLV